MIYRDLKPSCRGFVVDLLETETATDTIVSVTLIFSVVAWDQVVPFVVGFFLVCRIYAGGLVYLRGGIVEVEVSLLAVFLIDKISANALFSVVFSITRLDVVR